MTIISFTAGGAGQEGVVPRRVAIQSTDSLATVTTAGYLNNEVLSSSILPTDQIVMQYNWNAASRTGIIQNFYPSFGPTGVITLIQLSEVDVPLIVLGNIQAGASGTAGTVASFPSTASEGELILAAANNSSGNFNTTISNAAAVAQSQVITIPDSGAATGSFILNTVVGNTQNIVGNLTVTNNSVAISKLCLCGQASLASAGKINVFIAPTGTAQIAILDIKVIKSTGLSGNSGDRLLTLGDGTTVFNNAGITAALLGTPVFTIWGGTGNPLTASTAISTSAAGANVYLQYSGGTADYSVGTTSVLVTYFQITT